MCDSTNYTHLSDSSFIEVRHLLVSLQKITDKKAFCTSRQCLLILFY
nr:MAG TPA: hypothetical protein [Caudoviricetes sp.]